MNNNMDKGFKVIVTISDALVSNANKLIKIDSFGDCLYRINGAHVEVNSLSAIIKNLRTILPSPKIILDLPGNKIRTKDLSDPIRLIKGETFKLHSHQVNYLNFFSHLKAGNLILANDSNLTLEIKEVNHSNIVILSHSDGILQSNKGLHIHGIHHDIPFLFQKDLGLIQIACKENLDYISLSFVRTQEDIQEAKRVVTKNRGDAVEIIAKIETALAVENLGKIFEECDNVNIDRGDLSTDVGLLNLPAVQAYVIKSALDAHKSIFLATQFLKNMENNPVPSISEIVDLYKTIKSGITGIQLSEETAVGKYPVECVKLVFNVLGNLAQNLKYAGAVDEIKR